MSKSHYAQFCALARAAEILGERWTLLILRELLLGPQRFSDLRQRLSGITASVLTQRLKALEEQGLILCRRLEPPAASTVYELTEDGRDIEPAILALIRWGARFLLPARSKEHLDGAWIELVLRACARDTQVPSTSIELRILEGDRYRQVGIKGSRKGTEISPGLASADTILTATPDVVLALMSGILDVRGAKTKGKLKVEGNPNALKVFPQLFEVELQRKVG